MEKSGRRSEEKTYLNYLWIPFHFLNQILKAIFKCFGLLHQDSQTTTKTTSAPVTVNQPEEEDSDIPATKEEVVLASRGIKNGVVATSRGTKIKPKTKKRARVSSGSPGQHN